MTSRASTIGLAYAYRQGFQGQVRGVSDHAIEPTTNTLAGTRRAHMWQGRGGPRGAATDYQLRRHGPVDRTAYFHQRFMETPPQQEG
jgi:hypothetical protein